MDLVITNMTPPRAYARPFITCEFSTTKLDPVWTLKAPPSEAFVPSMIVSKNNALEE